MGAMISKETCMHTFQTPNPVRLRLEIPKGRVQVIAVETAETTVELVPMNGDMLAQAWIAEAQVAQHGDEIVVMVRKHGLAFFGVGGAIEATIRVPLGSAADLTTGSGRITTDGRLGNVRAASGSGAVILAQVADVHAHTGSGEITIASASGSANAKTGNGRVTIGKVGGDARIATGSGHAELAGAAGEAHVTTASGNIDVGEAGDILEAFAASGRIRVRRADHGRVKAKSISGGVSVGVAAGVSAWLDLSTTSGRVRSDLESAGEPGPGEKSVELRLETVSGNIEVQRA
jgi:DUF4097 and DUF4098 domain-containing protein YvlB